MAPSQFSKGRTKLPREVDALLVDSLFRDAASLVIGAVTTVLAIVVTAVKSGSTSLWACAALVVVVAAARLLAIRRYRRQKTVGVPLSKEAYDRWETTYGLGASLHCLLLGIWCLLCLTQTSDAFVQLLSAVVTIGCASAIPGRNFGRVEIALVQIAGLCVPLCIGWLLQKNLYYVFLTAVTIPFFAALRIMSVRLQATLLEALTANNELGTLAERFDTALTNMPHGLCMLDSGGRIVVHNPRLRELLKLGGAGDLRDAAFVSLLRRPGEGRCAMPSIEPAIARCEAMIEAGASGSASFDDDEGRSMFLTVQPMPHGGAVVLVEDITQRRTSEEKIRACRKLPALTVR